MRGRPKICDVRSASHSPQDSLPSVRRNPPPSGGFSFIAAMTRHVLRVAFKGPPPKRPRNPPSTGRVLFVRSGVLALAPKVFDERMVNAALTFPEIVLASNPPQPEICPERRSFTGLRHAFRAFHSSGSTTIAACATFARRQAGRAAGLALLGSVAFALASAWHLECRRSELQPRHRQSGHQRDGLFRRGLLRSRHAVLRPVVGGRSGAGGDLGLSAVPADAASTAWAGAAPPGSAQRCCSRRLPAA